MATDDADKFQDLAASLAQFTGTTRYYRISPGHLLTDGTRYLADTAGCYWIMDAVASHLAEIGTQDWFVLVRVQVSDGSALMLYEDGNGNEHARQEIPYTDFPLEQHRPLRLGSPADLVRPECLEHLSLLESPVLQRVLSDPPNSQLPLASL